MPRDSVPYNGLFSTTVIVRSKIGNQTNVRRNGDSYSGVAREHSEIQETNKRFHHPSMDFKAPKADIVILHHLINSDVLLTSQLTNQLVINPAKVYTVRSL